MRNDARPIGEHSPASPVGGHEAPLGREAPGDARDHVSRDRQSPAVHDGRDDAELERESPRPAPGTYHPE